MNTHPAAELFPLLEGKEYDALVTSIREHGLEHALVRAKDGRLLDGRNRFRACADAGVEPRFVTYDGDDLVDYIVRVNVIRRHLSYGQRCFVARDALPLAEAEAKKRSTQAPGEPRGTKLSPMADRPQETGLARDQVARTIGVSGRGVARAKRIGEQAPDLEKKVRADEISVDRAERIVRDRDAERRRVNEAKMQAASAPIALRVDLRLGDFRTVLADLTGVDAIITDPPYPAEYLPLLADLGAWADKVLAPDGVMAVLIGQTHLPEVYRLLDGHRPYRWTACYLTPGGGYVSHARKVFCGWKPVIVYGGGPRFGDVIRSEGADANAKSLHKWGQDYTAFHSLVERLTSPGQTVADLFMGSGTTLLAAHALGRHAVGCDVDEVAVKTARERLAWGKLQPAREVVA
jgi:16S rRNA G966 N2-methylase RsmD